MVREFIKFNNGDSKYKFAITECSNGLRIHCTDLYSKREFVVVLSDEKIEDITVEGGNRLGREKFFRLLSSALRSRSDHVNATLEIEDDKMEVTLEWKIKSDFFDEMNVFYKISLEEIKQSDVQLCNKMVRDVTNKRLKIKRDQDDYGLLIFLTIFVMIMLTIAINKKFCGDTVNEDLGYVEICKYSNMCSYSLSGKTYFVSDYGKILQIINNSIIDMSGNINVSRCFNSFSNITYPKIFRFK